MLLYGSAELFQATSDIGGKAIDAGVEVVVVAELFELLVVYVNRPVVVRDITSSAGPKCCLGPGSGVYVKVRPVA